MNIEFSKECIPVGCLAHSLTVSGRGGCLPGVSAWGVCAM